MPIWWMIHQFSSRLRDRKKGKIGRFVCVFVCAVKVFCAMHARALLCTYKQRTDGRMHSHRFIVHMRSVRSCVWWRAVLPHFYQFVIMFGLSTILWFHKCTCVAAAAAVCRYVKQWKTENRMQTRREIKWSRIDKRRNVIQHFEGSRAHTHTHTDTSIRKSFCLVFRSCHRNGTTEKAKWHHTTRIITGYAYIHIFQCCRKYLCVCAAVGRISSKNVENTSAAAVGLR